MKVYKFEVTELVIKVVSIEADSFMQAYDVVVSYYPHYMSLKPLDQNV
jgi:hypothetical protein